MPMLQLLSLLIIVNGGPILARKLLGRRWSRPVDGGRRWRDGRPLLGPSKTWRGIAAALLLGALGAPLLGIAVDWGLLIGAASMAGDLMSSFIKRRLGYAASSMALGLDQIPEALLPALLAAGELRLGAGEVALVVVLFFFVELALSQLLYKMGIRKQPY